MNTLRSRNDNGRGDKEQTSNPTEVGAGINVYGGTVNIENLELSIVLPGSKKKMTNRAFVLSYLMSILSTDTFKKNLAKFTFIHLQSLQKALNDQSILISGHKKNSASV